MHRSVRINRAIPSATISNIGRYIVGRWCVAYGLLWMWLYDMDFAWFSSIIVFSGIFVRRARTSRGSLGSTPANRPTSMVEEVHTKFYFILRTQILFPTYTIWPAIAQSVNHYETIWLKTLDTKNTTNSQNEYAKQPTNELKKSTYSTQQPSDDLARFTIYLFIYFSLYFNSRRRRRLYSMSF